MKKSKLAIVSSYNELCGNATYAFALKKEFEKYYNVDVLSLRVNLLRSENRQHKKLAQQHIDDLCSKLKDYDYVNIQLEVGLFGIKRRDIYSRLKKIVESSKNLIITMHRIDVKNSFLSVDFLKKVINSPMKAIKEYRDSSYYPSLYAKLILFFKYASNERNVNIIVHTKREKEIIKYMFGFDNVFDFPITFLNRNEIKYYCDKAIESNKVFRNRYNLGDSDVIIGVFGFISDYKGHLTAIKALRILPENYKLMIFGSQHPQSILSNSDIDPYLEILIKEIKNRRKGDLSNRVYFCGSLSDDEFITALNQVNFTVLPYKETGQSGSGVASITLETRAKSIFSNNKAFFELSKYAPGAFETFDIGNYVELAQKILFYRDNYSKGLIEYYDKYNIENNINLHISLFEKDKR